MRRSDGSLALVGVEVLPTSRCLCGVGVFVFDVFPSLAPLAPFVPPSAVVVFVPKVSRVSSHPAFSHINAERGRASIRGSV